MSKGKFSVTFLKKYEEMIESRFAPVLAAAERATAPLRFSIAEEVKKEWGIYELEAQLAIAKERVKSLEDELESKRGTKNGYSQRGWSSTDTRLEGEVKRRLRDRDGVYERISIEKKKIVDELWLAQAPTELVNIIRSIDTTGYMEEVKALEAKVVGMGLQIEMEAEDESM